MGWQLDGHHLIVNCFVLGDQVVLTPTFMGSEPPRADTGRFAGTAILEEELAAGLAVINALDEEQRAVAIIGGGSIQIPFAFCGVVGLKPTAGRVRTDGHLPEASAVTAGWNSVGPLAG